jgi:hypothetical protein
MGLVIKHLDLDLDFDLDFFIISTFLVNLGSFLRVGLGNILILLIDIKG